MGVALSSAVINYIDPKIGMDSVNFASTCLFLAFIFTLFPFYHGALRHLDDAYIENDSDHIKDGALIFDFFLLFIHGIVFIALSLLLSKPAQFTWILLFVLSIDVVWAIFAHFGSSSHEGKAEWKWGVINAIAAAIIFITIKYFDIGYMEIADAKFSEAISLTIAIAACFRTLADYIFCYKFYFPSDTS